MTIGDGVYKSGYRQGKIDLAGYLIHISQNIEGAALWVALFSEILERLKEDIPNGKQHRS